jgi:drug/metabolite transporter (DMT)-like permease
MAGSARTAAVAVLEAGDAGTARDLGAWASLALMVIIGSSTAAAAKFAVQDLPAGLLALIRFGGAGLCLLPLAWRGEGLGPLVRRDGGRLLAAAALCVPINQAFLLGGARLAPTTHIG